MVNKSLFFHYVQLIGMKMYCDPFRFIELSEMRLLHQAIIAIPTQCGRRNSYSVFGLI